MDRFLHSFLFGYTSFRVRRILRSIIILGTALGICSTFVYLVESTEEVAITTILIFGFIIIMLVISYLTEPDPNKTTNVTSNGVVEKETERHEIAETSHIQNSGEQIQATEETKDSAISPRRRATSIGVHVASFIAVYMFLYTILYFTELVFLIPLAVALSLFLCYPIARRLLQNWS